MEDKASASPCRYVARVFLKSEEQVECLGWMGAEVTSGSRNGTADLLQ